MALDKAVDGRFCEAKCVRGLARSAASEVCQAYHLDMSLVSEHRSFG